MPRFPSLFVPHGGGPLPLLNPDELSSFLSRAGKLLTVNNEKPKAILVVTAHWEEQQPTISSNEKHDLLYDYYGFPKEAYDITYPAPGEPTVAKRVHDLLKQAGFSPKFDLKRGWDHGVFIPLKLMIPEADIPVVQMSVLSSQDAEEHIRMGRALESLRDEGVAIVGSGMTMHNMQLLRVALFGGSKFITAPNKRFEDALEDACTSDQPIRDEKLKKWEQFPDVRNAQPKGAAEHLTPLFVVAGAGGDQKGKKVFDGEIAGFPISSFLWQ
jgi:aromatic ring-opening dioxygenase catalytic subunit (LigB family)